MRSLKFRVWCKRTQEYHTPIDEEDYDADGENIWLQMCIDTNGRLYFIETSNEDEDYEYVTQDCEIIENQNDNFIIEQYTGLKDKNGKEIYEGDILQIDDHILGDFEVLWHNLGWVIKRSIGFETLSVHKSEDIVVIGNIHENPELLEGKKCS